MSRCHEATRRARAACTLAAASLLLSAAARAAITGLAPIAAIGNDATVGITFPLGMVLSPDGIHLYVASGSDHRVVTFDRDPTTGALAFANAVQDDEGPLEGFLRPLALGMSPDGAHLYVLTSGRPALFTFARDGVSGRLTFVERTPLPDGSTQGGHGGFAFTSDGRHVYVTDKEADAIVVFARDAASGTLAFVELQQDSDEFGGVNGLGGAADVLLSPDEGNVYVAGDFDDSVAVFARDAASGRLTFIERHRSGMGGVTALNNPIALAMSPDGVHLYILGRRGYARFRRDASTGALTFVTNFLGFFNPFAFGTGRGDLAVTPDGARLYSAAAFGVNLFTRDATTGALTTVGGESAPGPSALVLSPDGSQIYVSGGKSGDSTVARFRHTTSACSPAPLTTCVTPVVPGQGELTVRIDPTVIFPPSQVKWKWVRGPAATLAAFGDPVEALDDVVLCIYDGSARPQPVQRHVAPAQGVCGTRACWQARATTLRYKDLGQLPHGLSTMTLKATPAGSLIKLTAKMSVLTTAGRPTFDDARVLPLPYTPPVIAQLQTAGGCFEARYSEPSVNDLFDFRAQAD